MQQHYFIGIKISSTFEEQVVEFKQKYELDAAYKVIPHVEDLHVTLLYLGALEEQLLPTIKKVLLEIAAAHPHFSLYVDGLSFFGPSFGPRVVYLSVAKSINLAALQRDVEIAVAKQLDMPISEHFTPHVTIAKKRKSTDKVLIQKENFKPIEMSVSSFSLFTVHPEMSPKYGEIETFQLHL